MTPHDEKRIVERMKGQKSPVQIALAGGSDQAGRRLADFLDRLRSIAPIVEKRPAPEEPFRSPALILGRHANIAYQAVPEGPEIDPFLKALGVAGETELGIATELRTQAANIDLPAHLVLFISMQCPHCPVVAAQLIEMADASARLRLTVIDALLFTEPAEAHDIRSVPTLILDERIRWTGQIQATEVLHQCIQRDPSQLSAASLRQIIESGEAARLAGTMAAHGACFPAMIDLLTSERWSVRLGAMVTVEYLVDEAPDLAAELVAPLWHRFDRLSEPIQGDVVQVIGQIGNDEAVACLQMIVSADYPESVREAAAEEIANRSNN